MLPPHCEIRAEHNLGNTTLEMNPLPTFVPDGSFGVLAEIEGRPLADLLAEVLAGGLERLGLG